MWQFAIDTGGTFTDCLALTPEGQPLRLKILSSSALRGRVMKIVGKKIEIDLPVMGVPDLFRGYTLHSLHQEEEYQIRGWEPASKTLTIDQEPTGIFRGSSIEIRSSEEAPVMAMRLLTQTSIDRPLPPLSLRLGSTRATNALLEMKGAPVALLINEGFSDLLEIGTQQRPELFSLNIKRPAPYYHRVIEVPGRLDARGEELRALPEEDLDDLVRKVVNSGCESVAIALLHSYQNPEHERRITTRLRAAGLKWISSSHELAPNIKLLPRAQTALVNAYLEPVMGGYLQSIAQSLPKEQLKVMTSAGGLHDYANFAAKDSLLSGPAGGVVGAAALAQQTGLGSILAMDMGGTSTDVSRYDGEFDYVHETRVGPAHLLSPALAIETVAAGGGSICGFDGHRLFVGPESGGAQPGPACYGAGGPLTLTDVNLLLGRLDPAAFRIPLDPAAAQKKFDEIRNQTGLAEEVLLHGWLQIANETMAGAIRKISVHRGYDPADYALVAFGGAGGQHLCAVASLLKMQRALVPYDAGLLSAVGMSRARIERFAMRQILRPLEAVKDELPSLIDGLTNEATQRLLRGEGLAELSGNQCWLFLRLEGQEETLEIPYENNPQKIEADFRKAYETLYGYWIPGRHIELESIRVQVWWQKEVSDKVAPATDRYQPLTSRKTNFGPVFSWDDLHPGALIQGPALLTNDFGTVVIEEGWTLELDQGLNAHLKSSATTSSEFDSNHQAQEISLELFTNRFKSVAQEMGAMLERTAFSVNVKERLDFSCALLDRSGELVVNAPHIPVHLGSLGECVRRIKQELEMKAGDVVISNHPGFGGSHLPDVTLVAPVFFQGERIGYVANRAHHAEIGGQRPGSMPTDARNLAEEGVVIYPRYLMRGGQPDWEGIRQILAQGRWPSRSPDENIADLRAALASLRRGMEMMGNLARQYGPEAILKHIDLLKSQAAQSALQAFSRLDPGKYTALEHLDDGTPLRVLIDLKPDRLSIDFSGSGDVHPGNFNATPAIVRSVVIYVIRLLAGQDIPLNEGLLSAVSIILPPGLLNPPFDQDPAKCPAVVGGNVETSQRLVDTILKALGLAACSQGTMNNLLFGNKHFGYYETIAGGTGAGPGFHGASGVHQHMTNTRITDPEVLEFRYPVRLESFGLRKGSGGKGKWNGGDGVSRHLTFLEPVSLTILASHRQLPPYGLAGGQPGAPGRQFRISTSGKMIEIGGVGGLEIRAGEGIIIETPGGGGYGKA